MSLSFSLSQNLLSDISSQGSQSDSSQPPTQPMIGYNMSTSSSRQNFTLPRPPSCPDLIRKPVAYSSNDQQRAKYSRQENSCSDKAGLGKTLREVQARLSSVPSSCSRMLEEGLVFLETEITKDKEMTIDRVMSVRDMLEEISDVSSVVKAEDEEMCEKTNTTLKRCMNMVESFKEVLVAVDVDQKNNAKVVEIMEEKLENQINFNRELMKDLISLHSGSKNMEEIVKKAVKEELERLRSQTVEELNTGWAGAAASCRRRTVGPSMGTGIASTIRSVHVSDVRGFSFANIQGKQVDFSSVMEVDEDDDWEE